MTADEHSVLRIRPTAAINGQMDSGGAPSSGMELRGRLSAFGRQRSAVDELPKQLDAQVALLSGALARMHPYFGRALPDESRRAVSVAGRDVYLVPTDTGAVCYAGGAPVLGCMASLLDELVGWNLTYEPSSRPRDVAVHGVVADGVKKLAVVFGSGSAEKRFPAAVGGNAFYVDIRDASIDPMDISKFEVTLESGAMVDLAARDS